MVTFIKAQIMSARFKDYCVTVWLFSNVVLIFNTFSGCILRFLPHMAKIFVFPHCFVVFSTGTFSPMFRLLWNHAQNYRIAPKQWNMWSDSPVN